jgi:hypothetical protein
MNYNDRKAALDMSTEGPKVITLLLKAWGAGDQDALRSGRTARASSRRDSPVAILPTGQRPCEARRKRQQHDKDGEHDNQSSQNRLLASRTAVLSSSGLPSAATPIYRH